jgi:hypothetical protein
VRGRLIQEHQPGGGVGRDIRHATVVARY